MVVGDIIKEAAPLLGDPSQDWCTDGYCMPFIPQLYNDFISDLKSIDYSFDNYDAILTPYTAGTIVLDAFMGAGQPLALMILPRRIWWKIVTDPDSSYIEAHKVDRLEDIDPSQVQGIAEFTWRHGQVQTPPSNTDITLRVEYDALFTAPTDDDGTITQLVSNCGNVMVYKLVEMIAGVRGWQKKEASAATKAAFYLSQIEQYLNKQDQYKVRRVGRSFGRRRARFMPNIRPN